MNQLNKLISLFFVVFVFSFYSCSKNSSYPKRYKNIPTGTSFFYGPNGNFYILPEEQLDSVSYRIKIYIDTTGEFKFEGIFRYINYTYNPTTLKNLDDKILYFNDSNKIFVRGSYNDTLTLLLDHKSIEGKNK